MLSSQLCRSPQVASRIKTPSNKINTIKFNLSTQYYGNLIPEIRNIAKQPGRFSHNRPVLPDQPNGDPQDWLEIALSTTEKTIYIRIRLDNLYLVGYRMQSGSWLEFDRKDKDGNYLPPLISEANFLGFNGSYDALAGASGRPIKGTSVSRETVIGAVNELGKAETGRSSIAKCLAILIMVICEATRFEDMSRRFADIMHSGTQKSVLIEDWMLDMFTSWGDLSGKLIRADADGDQYFRIPSNTNPPLKQKIKSALDAATYLALLCGPKYRHEALLAKNIGGEEYVPRGQPMMEVLSVQILNFTGDVSGTITVKDGLGPQTLFSRTQTVRKLGDTLTLELLNRAISAWQCVDINYNLTSARYQYRGTYSWDIFQSIDLYVDDNASACIQSIRLPRYGTRSTSTDEAVSINLGLFMEAYQIIWTMKIVNGDGYNPMNVYGSVNLLCSVGIFNYNVNLFSRSSDESEVVYVGGDIPLLRKAMAVPLDMDVTIDVNLWDYIRGSSAQCIAQRQVKTRFGSTNVAKDKFQIPNLVNASKSDVEISYNYNVVSMD